MKLFNYLFVCFILIFVSCYNLSSDKNEVKKDIVKVNSTWNIEGLKGEVKSINEMKYIADIEEIDSLGEVFNRIFYQYNKNGYLILQEEYDNNEILEIKAVHEVDCNGYIINSERFTGNNEGFYDNNVYHYNEDGYVNCIESYDENGELNGGNYFELNSEGKVMTAKLISGSTKKEIYKNYYTYDEKGRLKVLLATNIYDIESDSVKYTYAYTDDGLDLRTIAYSKDDELLHDFEFEYIFDKKGNWTRRLEIDKGILKHIYVREIEYW